MKYKILKGIIYKNLVAILKYQFKGSTDKELIFSSKKLKKIGDSAFENCQAKKIEGLEGVEKIGNLAFQDAEVEELKFSEKLREIGDSAFENCQAKKIEGLEGVEKIGEYAFADVKVEELKFSEKLRGIGYRAFYNCQAKKIEGLESVERIGKMAFEDAKVEELKFSEKLRGIGYRAFYKYQAKKIEGLEGVERIGYLAFQDAEVEELKFSEKLKEIEDEAFENCQAKKIEGLEGVEKIGMGAFQDAKVEELKFSEKLKIIWGRAFNNCQAKKIEGLEGVEKIKHLAFQDAKVEELKFSEKLREIGDSAFENCQAKKIEGLEGVEKIGEYTFADVKVEELKFSEKLRGIGDSAFYNCQAKKIEGLEGVETIGKFAFQDAKVEELKFSEKLKEINDGAFGNCQSKKIEGLEGVERIGAYAFGDTCFDYVTLSNNLKSIPKNLFQNAAYKGDRVKFLYISKDGLTLTVSKKRLPEFENTCIVVDISSDEKTEENKNFFIPNYRKNYCLVKKLKEEGKISFIPPDYILKTFPHEQLENFFINKNNQRWGKLTKEIGLQFLEKIQEKENSLTDLLKIYYSIGGFSTNQGESEQAYQYLLDLWKKENVKQEEIEKIGEEIHRRFSQIDLNGEYDKDFAKFFMNNYKSNPNFMIFQLDESESRDYLCIACNMFPKFKKRYPNRVINGNNERDLFSPRFIAEHCMSIEYTNVQEGNYYLAEIVGKYGYSQDQFEHIQEIYEEAKKQKNKYVIKAQKSGEEDDEITYNFLEKDDPLGFVLGDITNCCQRIGDAGESCVDDGYTNPEAGFLVFEEKLKDEKGQLTGQTRILAQAYIWYDPITKTVCYDNIEIPTKILDELKKKSSKLKVDDLLRAVEKSTEAVMNGMNINGKVMVERVTTGEGYNDLRNELKNKYALNYKKKSKHRGYFGYSDADRQFIIKRWADITAEKSHQIKNEIGMAIENLSKLEKTEEQTGSLYGK